MPDPVTFTDEEIAQQKAALLARKGAKSIAFADQAVTFEDSADTLRTMATMHGSQTRYAAHSKGF